MTDTLILTTALKEERDYWLSRLSGELDGADLPGDFRRSKVYSDKRGEVAIPLPADLGRRLLAFTKESAFLTCTTLMAALKVCLHKYTGAGLVVVGSPPYRPAGAPPQGPNVLAIADRVEGAESFRELLLKVRESLSGAYARQGYPFAQLVKDLGLEEAGNRCPLFDVVLVLADIHGELPELKNDLTFTFARTGGGIEGGVAFNARLFKRGTVERLAGHFVNVLRGALDDSGAPVSRLSLLGDDEREEIVRRWNKTREDYPREACLHQLFERQAARTPDAPALVFEGGRLTYGELNARANQLARLMRRRGVGADAPVALLLGRSSEQMIALLAALKAGGAYLPFDPALPARRIALLLEDARPRLTVTHRRLLDLLPPEHGEVVCLDADRDAISREEASDLRPEASPESLAYILYTSGSTGRPKGVAMPHRPLVNLMHWQLRHAAAGESARTAQFAPLSFDVSCQEIFSTWCGGGALVLVTEEVRRDPTAFWRLLAEEAVERLFVPFVYLQQLAEAMPAAIAAGADGGPAAGVRLREVLTAGEQLQVTPALVEMLRRLPGGVLVNQYGPTEAHVVSAHSLTGAPTRWPVLPPIGRPVSNARLYVLDAHGRPVPVGVSGELHIGGACVARGYLNRPGLTAERFVPDPYGDEPGARLYRTGDVARLTAEGEIEYVGRADEQVKVRGFRVELGEVEAALAAHADVRACAAAVRGEGAAGKRLVAYVVADAGQAPSAAVLRGHMKERVPEYMVPSAFVILDALPLTASGKVNRRALPEPDAARPEQGKAHVAPRTPTEESLARIWAEVLGLEQVGVNDNFFELGGDSILTIQVVARANQVGLRLIPRQLFQCQTIAKLAAVAGTASRVEAEQGAVTGDVPLTPVQHWLLEQRLPAPHHFNMSYLFELRQEVDERVLREGVRALCEHHDALRMRFVREADGWRQFNAAPDDRVPFESFDLAGMDEAGQRRAVESEAARLQASLDLTDGPLVRVALFGRGGERRALLLFVAHHLVVDGVSWRVLLEDLQTACGQMRGGQPASLPAKTTSYKRWAERLEEYARSEAARAELDYWLSEHGGAAAPLPVDFVGGERLESSAEVLAVALDVEETEALLREVPKFRRLRINDILLAALARSFARWTGGAPLRLELEGHGREEDVVEGVDISRTVGWFTSIFPVRLDLGGAATAEEVLETVRERLERIPHAGVGYGLLRYLGGEEAAAKLASLPRAEVSFNYLGQADQSFGENSLLSLAQESAGPAVGPETAMPHLLYVAGIVYDGRLNVRFKYSRNVHRAATVEALARSYVEELRALIAYCREAGRAEAGEAPREFPLARLGGAELEAALSLVEFAREGGGWSPARDNVEDVYPLSPAQVGILFHSIYAPESGVYVVQIHCSLRGLDAPAVERAWQAVVDRNPILRTAFVWENVARPLQVVGRRVAVPWQRLDWRDASPDEQAERFNRYLEDERARGFKLTQGPLMRMGLIRVGDDAYKFVWTHHHLLLDGWSIYLVLKELFTFYDSLALDAAPGPESTRPFGDYINWLESRDPVEAEEFWRRTLRGFDSPTPVGRETGAAPGDGEERHGELRVFLSAADSAAVRDFARRHRLTVNTVVQGAWALLLGHSGGRSDVAFGATASGRPAELPGIETMVGMFINVLPMRVKLPDGETLAAWLGGIQEAQFEVRQYEYSPLVQVQRASDVPRGVPLFDSILSFENYPVDNSIQEHTRSLNLSDVYNVSRTNYPLTVIVGPRAERMALRFVYDRRRFDAASAGHLASQFASLLREFTERPDATLGELRQGLARADEGQRHVGEARAEESKRARFKAVKPKAVSLPSDPVRTAPLQDGSPLPLVVEPAAADADLAGWAAHNREWIERRLCEHGALLLRGFPVDSVEKFERVAAGVCPRLFGEYGDLPREGEGGRVYGSTPYPADQAILFHNESSHLHRWPMKIFFYCVRAAQAGGETPVVDCREVYRLLPRAVAGRFAEKGLMYVRNFIEGLDISWQTFYGTADRRVVEARCRESGTEFEWRGDNWLRTRRVCPAVARHPRTGETVFFNQVQLHHVSCLEQSLRETLLSMYGEEELPRNVYYGDGSPVEDSVVAEVVETYRRAAVSFPWREGDVLLLDNMLTAHARNPYTGPRKIVVAMGEMTDGDAATPERGA